MKFYKEVGNCEKRRGGLAACRYIGKRAEISALEIGPGDTQFLHFGLQGRALKA